MYAYSMKTDTHILLYSDFWGNTSGQNIKRSIFVSKEDTAPLWLHRFTHKPRRSSWTAVSTYFSGLWCVTSSWTHILYTKLHINTNTNSGTPDNFVFQNPVHQLKRMHKQSRTIYSYAYTLTVNRADNVSKNYKKTCYALRLRKRISFSTDFQIPLLSLPRGMPHKRLVSIN